MLSLWRHESSLAFFRNGKKFKLCRILHKKAQNLNFQKPIFIFLKNAPFGLTFFDVARFYSVQGYPTLLWTVFKLNQWNKKSFLIYICICMSVYVRLNSCLKSGRNVVFCRKHNTGFKMWTHVVLAILQS